MDFIDTLSKAFDLFVNYESQPDSIRTLINPLLSVIFIVFTFFYILSKLNLERWVEHFDKRHKPKINTLLEVISCESSPKDLQEIANDILQANYFKEATKIYAEKGKRTQLMTLYKKLDGKFTWEDIKLSLEYAKFDTDEVTYIDFKTRHQVGYWFNKVIGLSSAAFSFLILIFIFLFYNNHSLDIKSGITLLFQMCFMFFLGLLYLKRNWRYSAALKISKYLCSQRDSV